METLNEISRLISMAVLEQTLSEEERKILSQWMEEGDNMDTFESVRKMESVALFLKLEREGYGEKMAARFRKMQRQRKYRTTYKKWSLYAGGVAAAILVVMSIFLFFSERDIEMQSEKEEITSAIASGGVKAILTLPDGRTIGIGDKEQGKVRQLMDSVYTVPTSTPEEIKEQAYSILSIPKGGEFFIELEDGSKVWLNSESELRFPETFDTDEHRVFLKGEAFFEVNKSDSYPFIVSTARGDIQVYGTRFNVADYAGQPFAAVLVEGSIAFRSPSGEQRRMTPSQRLLYYADSEQIEVESVDVSTYTSWVNQLFIFHNQSLEEIMTTLSRWYNFDVTFENDDLRQIKLSGRLFRYDNIQVLLESYERVAGVKFRIEGRNILITK